MPSYQKTSATALLHLWKEYNSMKDITYKMLRLSLLYTSNYLVNREGPSHAYRNVLDEEDLFLPFFENEEMPFETLMKNLEKDCQKQWVLQCLGEERIRALKDLVNFLNNNNTSYYTEKVMTAIELEKNINLWCKVFINKDNLYGYNYTHFLSTRYGWNTFKNEPITDIPLRLKRIGTFAENWGDFFPRKFKKTCAETIRADILKGHEENQKEYKGREAWHPRRNISDDKENITLWKEHLKKCFAAPPSVKRKMQTKEKEEWEEQEEEELKMKKKMKMT